ncbi:MAG TPA: hypothetical protein VEZ55_06115, partial [Chitinophagaceae bacterium]|nr:hypothetical protein [Chitinophagaceae bacterium]
TLFGDESAADLILTNYQSLSFGQQKLDEFATMVQFLAAVKSNETFKRGIDIMVETRDQIPAAYKDQLVPYIEGTLVNLARAKTSRGLTEQGQYIEKKLKEPSSKTF